MPRDELRGYRPDIDGLRAVAVVLVVTFHLDAALPARIPLWGGRSLHMPTGLVLFTPTGGFVGVDIFFVISGFLIGAILLREQANGTLSLARFYERRVRRIVPALAALLLFTCGVAWCAFFPAQMNGFARSLLAATLSLSNIFFWRTSGYFDPPSLSQPLLHTWSLSVEEQFYLAFPLLLLALRGVGRKVLTVVIVLLAVLSFAMCVVLLPHHQTGVFYLPVTRAWELLLGTILALGFVPVPATRVSRNLAAASGLGLILWAAFHYTGHTRFPGPAALAPCGGAALVLTAGVTGNSVVGRMLSWRPVVFVGLISYSLYLWHWPLILINRLEYFRCFHASKPVLALLILAVAALSWRFVERPFRDGRLRLSRRQVFWLAAVAAGVLTVFSAWGTASHGFPVRFTPEIVRLDHYADQGLHETRWGDDCFASVTVFAIKARCLTLSKDQPNVLLFGDSQIAHLWYGLSEFNPKIHFLEATASECSPLPRSLSSAAPFCSHLVRQVFDEFLPSHHVDAVILSSLWTVQDIQPLGETVQRLYSAGLRVYVVGPIKFYDQPLPTLLIKAELTGEKGLPTRHLGWTAEEYADLDQRLAAASMGNGAFRYISLRQLLCPASGCLEYVSPGVPLQYDNRHLTSEGSLLVAQMLRDQHLLP